MYVAAVGFTGSGQFSPGIFRTPQRAGVPAELHIYASGGHSLWGGELFLAPGVYLYAKGRGWQVCEYRQQTIHYDSPNLDPRRILQLWRSTWVTVDLGNNSEMELKGLGWA